MDRLFRHSPPQLFKQIPHKRIKTAQLWTVKNHIQRTWFKLSYMCSSDVSCWSWMHWQPFLRYVCCLFHFSFNPILRIFPCLYDFFFSVSFPFSILQYMRIANVISVVHFGVKNVMPNLGKMHVNSFSVFVRIAIITLAIRKIHIWNRRIVISETFISIYSLSKTETKKNG